MATDSDLDVLLPAAVEEEVVVEEVEDLEGESTLDEGEGSHIKDKKEKKEKKKKKKQKKKDEVKKEKRKKEAVKVEVQVQEQEQEQGGEVKVNARKGELEMTSPRTEEAREEVEKANLGKHKTGTDLLNTGLSLPASFYEPLTVLQRGAEAMNNAKLLDSAAATTDETVQFAYVLAFAISAYSSTQDKRTKTNFNPILGESFEYVKGDLKFISEQVSHHPPVSAVHCRSGDDWTFWQNSGPVTRFTGNGVDLDTNTRMHIYLHKSKQHYYLTNPKTVIHNVLIGRLWFEHHGDLMVDNLTNGMSCRCHFDSTGFFQSIQRSVKGIIVDSTKKTKLVEVKGEWNGELKATWLRASEKQSKGSVIELWKCEDHMFVKPFNMPRFAAEQLSAYTPELLAILPSTDSRRRVDRKLLELGLKDDATSWKKQFEAHQRAEEKARTSEWSPCWFKPLADGDTSIALDKTVDVKSSHFAGFWVYSGGYWESRKLREDGVDSTFVYSEKIANTACDFLSFEGGAQYFDESQYQPKKKS